MGVKVMIAVDGSEYAQNAFNCLSKAWHYTRRNCSNEGIKEQAFYKKESKRSLQRYLNHAHRADNDIILAHVAEVAVQPTYAFRAGLALPKEEWDMMIKEQEEKIKELGKKFGDKLKSQGIKFKFRTEEGDAGHHLCHIAKKDNVDMIVMGTRGQGTVRRTVLGSVSDYVLHHSHVPVAICRH